MTTVSSALKTVQQPTPVLQTKSVSTLETEQDSVCVRMDMNCFLMESVEQSHCVVNPIHVLQEHCVETNLDPMSVSVQLTPLVTPMSRDVSQL